MEDRQMEDRRPEGKEKPVGKTDRPVIELTDICKNFPGVKALDHASLRVYPGEVHALMGENGAGKSTLIKVIAGVHRVDGGSYRMDGEEVQIQCPADARSKGISVVYQELNMVSDLSVAENIFFGNYPRKSRGLVDWQKLKTDAEAILQELETDIDPMMKVGYLPVGKQQLVEIAKSLAVHPRVLIMDEPTSALSLKEVQHLYTIIRKLKSKGVAIIYVSHKLDEIYEITDTITVMRDGQYIGTGKTKDLDEKTLVRMMVGHSVEGISTRESVKREERILEVEKLNTDHVRDISLYLKKGEVVGLAGLMGAGRTELARAIIGADHRNSGTVRVEGKSLAANNVSKAKSMGIGLVPEDRKQAGIIAKQGVDFNISIASLPQLRAGITVSEKREKEEVERQIRDLGIKTATSKVHVETLSGGNQQKVILGRWLMKEDLKILIIDEPTRGIDVGAKSEIYKILDQMAKKGVAILMISSELPEIIHLCDRVYVMNNGRIRGELNREEVEITQEEVLRLAI